MQPLRWPNIQADLKYVELYAFITNHLIWNMCQMAL